VRTQQSDEIRARVSMLWSARTGEWGYSMRRVLFCTLFSILPAIGSAQSVTERKEISRERIWNPEVRVHGSIATVWAPYDFWVDGKFSHCGVDAFDLIKTPDGWKIAGGVFTMEAKCEPSPLGPPKQ